MMMGEDCNRHERYSNAVDIDIFSTIHLSQPIHATKLERIGQAQSLDKLSSGWDRGLLARLISREWAGPIYLAFHRVNGAQARLLNQLLDE